jgi:hypothetical protein
MRDGIPSRHPALHPLFRAQATRNEIPDAYTYGQSDPERAFAEATLALDGGLDTPRVHAILAAALHAFGELEAAATHIQRHLELVTTELVSTAPLAAGDSTALDLVPGRTYAIPVAATAEETISVSTTSRDFVGSIALLLGPDGSPVVGSDDVNAYFAAFEWVAQETGTIPLAGHFVRERQHRKAGRDTRLRARHGGADRAICAGSR